MVSDDRWRDSYDAWKLASPYDDYEESEEDYCDHADYECNFEGRAECSCGHSWLMTPAQLEAHDRAMIELQREYDEDIRRERRANRPWRRAWRWLLARFKRRPPADELDIPF